MATRRKATPVEDELEELEELDEVTEADEAEDDGPSDALSAKEAANKLKVDARTFRKFLRSKYGKIGQGNRWAIEVDEFEALKAEFEAWHKPKPTPKEKSAKVTPPADEPEVLDELDADDEFDDLDELEEV